jgi:DNA polymerase III subunit alpha
LICGVCQQVAKTPAIRQLEEQGHFPVNCCLHRRKPRSMSRPFVHLHCHTHYSLLDGATKIPDLVKQVQALGMNACAITDHGNLYGALEFYSKCRDAGINPIIGYEAYIAPGSRRDRSATRMKDASFHLTLLAMNQTGFKNLVRMASSAYLDGYHYRPRIDKELLAGHHEGVICLSGCASSELSRNLLAEEREKAEKLVKWYVDLFGDRFYMEIQDAGVEIQQSCAEATIDLANRMGLPLVATNDAHYLCQDNASMHDVLLCVNTKSVVSDTNRMKMTTDQLFVRSPDQMYEAFPSQAEAVARSQEIANRCDIQLDLKTRHFPVFTPPPGKSDVEHLRDVAYDGLKWRYGDNPEQKYIDRLEFELGVIQRMGFASYFLIVWDFARFARDKGIPCSAPSWPTSSASATSARSSTTSCLNASSIPIVPKRPISTSTSARTAVNSSSSTSRKSTATRMSPRSEHSAR